MSATLLSRYATENSVKWCIVLCKILWILDFGPGYGTGWRSMFSVILLLYLIRKFPGLFGHPLTD